MRRDILSFSRAAAAAVSAARMRAILFIDPVRSRTFRVVTSVISGETERERENWSRPNFGREKEKRTQKGREREKWRQCIIE